LLVNVYVNFVSWDAYLSIGNTVEVAYCNSKHIELGWLTILKLWPFWDWLCLKIN